MIPLPAATWLNWLRRHAGKSRIALNLVARPLYHGSSLPRIPVFKVSLSRPGVAKLSSFPLSSPRSVTCMFEL
jgi:hypothetical protein